MSEDCYKARYRLMPVTYSSDEVTEYGIDLVDKQNCIKLSLKIWESDEFQYGTPEYDFWEEHNGGYTDMPQIQVWEAAKCMVYPMRDKEIEEEVLGSKESTELYRDTAISYPSEKYDEMFEKIIFEHFGTSAALTIIQFLEIYCR